MNLINLTKSQCIIIQSKDELDKVKHILRGRPDSNQTYPCFIAKRGDTFGLQDNTEDEYGKQLRPFNLDEITL